jgi:Protein of unknown function (DUF1553)/Protein of unknown function (DUF1549)/Planctomycete cytochrome C
MPRPARHALIFALLLAGAGLAPCVLGANEQGDAEYFETAVRPLLSDQCFSCHSQKAGKTKGGLRADSRQTLLTGGETGPALVPGHPEASLMIKAVSYQDADLQMPPKKRLAPVQVAILSEWIARGAPWPAETAVSVGKAPAKVISSSDADHWAWSPLRAYDPPAVAAAGWVRSPIDRFVLARLEAQGLHPAAEAERRTLARRAAFAITGLPPAPDLVERFVADAAPEAYERLIDILLASPQYGERWARHWLDLVRYAETRGHEFDLTIPNAYQYRDYVIRAFNSDLPYCDFVREQIAGDLLPHPRLNAAKGFNESILGTGFWFLGEGVHSPVDIRQDEADRLDNMVDVSCKTLLGLTVGCARCHDHKFDPITTKDYYALGGFLQSSSYRQVRFESLEHNRAVAARLSALRSECDHPLRAATAAALTPGVRQLGDYLLAALEVAPDASGEPLAAVAERRHLDAHRLQAWCDHLSAAVKNPDDPFSAWAQLRQLHAPERPQRLAGVLAGRAGELERQEADFAAAISRCAPVVSYGDRTEPWLPDDVSFGAHACAQGALLYGGDPAHPRLGLSDRAAGRFDPLWQRIGLEGDSAIDVGALNLVRAGRTLRTRDLTLGEDTLQIMVRGKGAIYVAVDSHLLINGPLHGSLVQRLDGKAAGWHWAGFDQRPYAGHVAHLEFTAEDQNFAVAMVLQGAGAPPPPPPPSAPLAGLLRHATTGEMLAAGYQALMEEALGQLRDDPAAADGTPGRVALAGWLLEHPELVGSADCQPLAELATRQSALAADIQEKSHLALAMLDGTGVERHVLIRGSARNPGETAPRRLPESIFGSDQPPIGGGSGRLEWAERLLSARDPFVPRVIVNRVWHHLVGRGIVASVDNFGALGERPSHPELLDYLARQFVADGWSIKRLIRAIMCSATYRMESAADPAQDGKDPDNRLLHRAFLHRLEGEAIRDEILAVSGRLNPAAFGPAVPIHLSDFLEGRGRPESGPLDGNGRRSIYLSISRNFLAPMMLAFDTPIPFNTMGRRASSNVPAQALIMMNDPFVIQQAELWAKRLPPDATSDKRIAAMYLQAFAREPLPAEREAALAFLAAAEPGKAPGARAWSDLAHALFNTKEFIFIQ